MSYCRNIVECELKGSGCWERTKGKRQEQTRKMWLKKKVFQNKYSLSTEFCIDVGCAVATSSAEVSGSLVSIQCPSCSCFSPVLSPLQPFTVPVH